MSAIQAFFERLVNVSEGAVVEAQWAMPSPTSRLSDWPGFLIEFANEPGALCIVMQPDGLVAVGNYVRETPFNYSALPAAMPTHDASSDWAFAGGASAVGSRAPGSNGSDIRSGSPGGHSTAYLAHPLDSQGHLLESVEFAFQYVAGYSPPEGQVKKGSIVSLVLLDAFNHSLIKKLWSSSELSNYSYDHFTSESPPIIATLKGLGIEWTRQMQLALAIENNDRNLQIPMQTLNVTVGWGGLQPASYEPEPLALVTVRERWERDLSPQQLGASVQARLLYRRDMLELYLNDFLYPVYAFTRSTGRIGITNSSAVTDVRRWQMSLPGEPSKEEHAQVVLV